MEINKVVVGSLGTNCYILSTGDKQIIIDPGDQFDLIDKYLVNPIAVIITHYHYDHIGALDELVNKYNIDVIDYKNIGIHNIDDFSFEVIRVPGHHETCIMIKFGNLMFTGDFLFKGTVGRTDLDTGSMKVMRESIETIKKYDDLVIYPGHGEETTLLYEKEHNRYLM